MNLLCIGSLRSMSGSRSMSGAGSWARSWSGSS